jgi:hypothetical protein
LSKRLDTYDASVLVFEEAARSRTSTLEELRERLFELAEKLRHEAMRFDDCKCETCVKKGAA